MSNKLANTYTHTCTSITRHHFSIIAVLESPKYCLLSDGLIAALGIAADELQSVNKCTL